MQRSGLGAGRRAPARNLCALLLQLARRPPGGHPALRSSCFQSAEVRPAGLEPPQRRRPAGVSGNRFCSPGLRLPTSLQDGHRHDHDSVVAGVGGGGPCLRGQHVGAAEGGRRCPRAPSACRRRPAHRSFWGGATGRPFICLQVARDAEGRGSQPAGLTTALRPAAGTRPGRGGPAASARAGAAEPEPKHPVESGRLLGDSLEQSASDGVGRAAGRPGRAAVAGRRRGRGNLGRLRGHKGRKYLELDNVRGSHSGDA